MIAIVLPWLAAGVLLAASVSSVGLEAVLAARPLQPLSVPNVLLTIGVAGTHFNSRLQQAALADCSPLDGCLAEGVVRYPTGTYLTWGPGIALDLPVAAAFVLRTHGRAPLTGADPPRGTRTALRLDVGITWRP